MNYRIKRKLSESCILIAISIFAISLFSYCSFLYEFNPWSDLNIFLTIGRGMLQGKQMYADLFDHKGPILYALYELCALISDSSFIGVYFVEVISLSVFLLFSHKILRLFSHKNHYLWLMVCALMICGSNAFSFGGGSVEEFSLPMIQCCNYLALSRMKNNDNFHNTEAIVFGLSAAVLFLMKFTLSGYFLGLAVVVVFYQLKTDKKQVKKCILSAFGSFLALNILVVGFFAIANSINSYIESYYEFNLFSYSSGETILISVYKMIRALGFYIKNNLLLMTASISGIIAVLFFSRKEKWVLRFLICTLVCWYIVSFIGGRFIAYYILPAGVYSVFAVLLLECLNKPIQYGVASILILLSLFYSNNIRHIGEKESVRHSFVSEIKTSDPSNTFLMYEGYDEGFYMIAHETPACRIFTTINSSNIDLQQERDDCVNRQKIDYLISTDHELQLENYILIREEFGNYDDQVRVYRLYKRKGQGK